MKQKAFARRLASETWEPAFWLLWLLTALGFAIVAGFAAATDYFPADLWLAHRLQDIDSAPFADALDWAARLAEMPLVAVVGLGGALGLALLASRLGAIWLVAALILSLSNSGVKVLVDRPRPSDDLVDVSEKASSLSFPSGHVTAAVLVYGFIFYLAAILIPVRPLRLLVQTSCLVIIVLNVLQRVYVGVHWPSDVLGGLLFGGLVLSFLIWSHHRFRSLTADKPLFARTGRER
ncbi:MAG: phosphatase PAP2 family protein [Dehalococcoidia bacterium]|nr:MAG: phosphatase PAP2 family protein [Dehalococcoidia bacterium]